MRASVFWTVVLALLAAGCARHKTTSKATRAEAREYRELYGKPLTSLGAKYAQLTPACQATVLAEVGSAEIYDVTKDVKNGHVFFKIDFRDSAVFPPMYLAPDGSVLNPDLSVAVAAPKDITASVATAIAMDELPLEVHKVLLDHAPKAEVALINKEAWGEHTVYVITFKDEDRFPPLHVLDDGTRLYETPK
jgi:hypothetical protein